MDTTHTKIKKTVIFQVLVNVNLKTNLNLPPFEQ